jgi:hypothetical protein
MKAHHLVSALLNAALLTALISGCATSQAKLEARAKVSKAEAERIALSRVPGGTIQATELEEERGRLVWSFEISPPGASDITEVLVDAVAGDIVAVEKEPLAATGGDTKGFVDTFRVDKSDLTSTGRNRFFVLEPGFVLRLEGKNGAKTTVLVITVLNDTRLADGVETRVVEEKESVNGQLVEVSRNFLAISKKTSDVFYFGEEVDIYKNGKILKHEGAWLSGVKGARFGLAMPATPVVGARYYQELAPKVAMDRVEVVSLMATLETPAGSFENCLKTEESTPLENGKEYKLYAPEIGLIQDGALKLTQYGRLTR